MSRLLAIAATLALALPAPALAQPTNGNVVVTLVEVLQGTEVIRDDEEDLNRALGAKECADMDNITLRFRAQPISAGLEFVDLWVGDSMEDCATTTARVSGDMRQCEHLAVNGDPSSTDGIFDISLTDLLLNNTACQDGGAKITFNLWVFATGTDETTSEVTADQYGYVAFSVDPTPPTAPSPRSATSSGDTGIPVTWSEVDEANVEYFVYIDTNTDAGCTLESMYLKPGEAPPELPIDGVTRQRTGVDDTSASINGGNIGLEFGESALVGVVALDEADNESVVSSLVCITRVESLGFCEVYESMGEDKCPSGCAASPLPRRGAGLPVALLLVGGLALVARRRRR